MSIIIPANSAVSGGFEASNSLMFNRADVPYLNRTAGTPTNSKKNTLSVWLKRSGLGAATFFNGGTNDQNQNFINFNPNNKIFIQNTTSNSNTLINVTTQVFRDTSAWYHIVLAIDTTQGTASNRVKLYVNGVQVTVFDTETQPSQNLDVEWNKNGATLEIGKYPFDSTGANVYDGYMSEFVFIDGTQNAPTDFGEFDEDSGIWKPIDVSGLTFGDNGFYLDFEDSSALGNDANGSNNFSLNNLAATDQGTDTCTNNFATLNSLNAFYTNSTFSNGNTTFASGNSSSGTVGNILLDTGKWYWEVKIISKAGGGDNYLVGIQGQDSTATNQAPADLATGWVFYGGGNYYNNGSGQTAGVSYAAGNTIGVALDLTNNKIYWSKDGVFILSGNPSTGSNGISITAPASVPLGGYYPTATFWENSTSATFSMNFGSPYYAITSGNSDSNNYGDFEYDVPGGFFSINTKNLAEYG